MMRLRPSAPMYSDTCEALKSLGGVIVAVEILAFQREEKFTATDGAAVSGDSSTLAEY